MNSLKDVEERSETFNTDEDPSGWRPYYTFIERLREKYALNDVVQGKDTYLNQDYAKIVIKFLADSQFLLVFLFSCVL